MRYDIVSVPVDSIPSIPDSRYSPVGNPPPQVLSMEDFAHLVNDVIKPFLGDEMSTLGADRISARINELLDQIEMHRQRVEFSPWVYLRKIRLKLVRANADNSFVTKIETDRIWTEGRYARKFELHPGECAYLGKASDDDDVYIGYQGNLPPTLIFKYGSHPSNYTTFNPVLQNRTHVVTDKKYSDASVLYYNATKFLEMTDGS